ncbi:alpha/beta fold hydrolase [Streptomyces sp. NPDC051913]|uniref:alpha/beta fold hydrolase n=1 Tax=Streptomyces sp. NPDC051913 TaxID=3365676 RepID=UPI0037D0344C
MKYFVAQGEDRRLTVESRQALRGSFVELSDGVTHYELKGPEDGEMVVMAGGLTIPLFYWDGLVTELNARGLRTLTCSAYGRGYSDRVRARYDETLFARQLTELTERLGLTTRPLHLVGTSMGALVAMTYARPAPLVGVHPDHRRPRRSRETAADLPSPDTGQRSAGRYRRPAARPPDTPGAPRAQRPRP